MVLAGALVWAELATTPDLDLTTRAKDDVNLRNVLAWNTHWSDKFVTQGPEPVDKPASLWSGREFFAKVAVLTKQYEVSGNRKYADRAVQEMRAAAVLKDWQPSSFLTVSEYTMGMSEGLLRLKRVIGPEDRRSLILGLRRNGLDPALEAYQNRDEWTTRRNNWGQVCGSAVLLGLLADPEYPDRANLEFRALSQAQESAKYLQPHGVSHEGPTYWRYGLNALWLADAELKRARKQGLLTGIDLKSAARAAWALRGPTGKVFNYADSSENYWVTPFMLDFAAKSGENHLLGEFARVMGGTLGLNQAFNEEWRWMPYALDNWPEIKRDEGSRPPDNTLIRLSSNVSGGTDQLAVLRSRGAHESGAWVAIKGGRNEEPHAHLDLGSFVYEVQGVRWAVDLGKDDYDLPGYFEGGRNGRRWGYLRCGTSAHNTLTFGGKNQSVKGAAGISMNTAGPLPSAEVDLRAPYIDWDGLVRRKFVLEDLFSLRITDSFARTRAAGRWAMTTRASIELSGSTAALTSGSKKLTAKIIGSLGLKWSVETFNPRPGEGPTNEVRQLVLRFPKGTTRVEVLLSPGDQERH